MADFQKILSIIRDKYPNTENIPLHQPSISAIEKANVMEALESGEISSHGKFIDSLKKQITKLTNVKHAILTNSGTSALHVALIALDVRSNDEVLTQGLTFIATANAVRYVGAIPLFLDIDPKTFGLSATSLQKFLESNAEIKNGNCYNKNSGNRIKCCIPVHLFGYPCEIGRIVEICKEWSIAVLEDAAESFGSCLDGKHTGTFGDIGIFSFNGNKMISGGSGGALITNDREKAERIELMIRQSKLIHPWKYVHDSVGYNYEMSNIVAAVISGHVDRLNSMMFSKEELFHYYKSKFNAVGISILEPSAKAKPNYWLNGILFSEKSDRDQFLSFSNESGVQCREAWQLLDDGSIYGNFWNDGLSNAKKIHNALALIPSWHN